MAIIVLWCRESDGLHIGWNIATFYISASRCINSISSNGVNISRYLLQERKGSREARYHYWLALRSDWLKTNNESPSASDMVVFYKTHGNSCINLIRCFAEVPRTWQFQFSARHHAACALLLPMNRMLVDLLGESCRSYGRGARWAGRR